MSNNNGLIKEASAIGFAIIISIFMIYTIHLIHENFFEGPHAQGVIPFLEITLCSTVFIAFAKEETIDIFYALRGNRRRHANTHEWIKVLCLVVWISIMIYAMFGG